MSYLVLSLKWRPQVFTDVVGQDHIIRTLINAFKKDRIAQAYLFTGPRGIGKTTTARILAKALNCLKTSGNPCNDCVNCQEIASGRNMDVLEIDGASNRGIEEIRNLRELIKYTPINSKYKIFIIDEVHMLTTPAFNALLRTLEEPPSHGKFILATTDIHKVPATIISRCQRFDFNRITIHTISERIRYIMDQEKITIDEESVRALARKADGSMRDALSILDQIIAYSSDEITYDDVVKVIGLIPYDMYFQFTEALKAKNSPMLIQFIEEIRANGLPVNEIVLGLNEHIRNLMFASVPGGMEVLEMNQDLKDRYVEVAKDWDIHDLLRIAQLLSDLEVRVRHAIQPYILLEMTVLKLLEMDASVSIEDVLQKLSNSRPSPELAYRSPVTSGQTVGKQSFSEADRENRDLSLFDKQEIPAKSKISEPEKNEEVETISKSDPDESDLFQVINSKWKLISDAIAENRPSIGSILEHCEPKKIENNQLQVLMVDQPQFNLNLLDNNSRLIEDELEKNIGQRIRLKFATDNRHRSRGKKLSTDSKNQNKLEKGSTITRIIELFDGEIR